MNKQYVIGVDLGGTKINIAIADIKGNIVINEIRDTEAYFGEKHIVNNILKQIEHLLRKWILAQKI